MPINPGQGNQEGNPLDEINGKLDAIMKHLGCEYNGQMNQDGYMNMSDEEKDKMDEKQIMGKT